MTKVTPANSLWNGICCLLGGDEDGGVEATSEDDWDGAGEKVAAVTGEGAGDGSGLFRLLGVSSDRSRDDDRRFFTTFGVAIFFDGEVVDWLESGLVISIDWMSLSGLFLLAV